MCVYVQFIRVGYVSPECCYFISGAFLPGAKPSMSMLPETVSQSGFGHGHAIDTSSRTDPQRGRCEYEVESLLWQSCLTLLVL